MNVLVVGGGDSPEREVSLRSAKAVNEALELAGVNTSQFDPRNKAKSWVEDISANTMVFPILHGKGGEDGEIQKLLESRHLPFLGTNSKSSANCFNKWTTRQLFSKAGLPIAQGELVDLKSYYQSSLFHHPHVLKVLHGGSSIGTIIVREPSKIEEKKVKELFLLDNQAVIEELVEGVEITVPILDSKALPVIEIVPPKGLEFDYENKYNGATAEICPPQNVTQKLQNTAQTLAETAHKIMGCRHLSRVDMIVKPDGKVVLLEINTIPGLTSQSLYPKSAAAAGIPMQKLVKQFVQMVIRDYNL